LPNLQKLSHLNQLLTERIRQKLQERVDSHTLRRLSLPVAAADFYSNDYLGLARNPELADLVQRAYAQAREPNRLGATGSRLLSGNSAYAMQLEEKLAGVFRGQAALLFNSGYAANLAVLACLAQKGDLILYDELLHASLREGYRLSFAAHSSFRHNDPADLAAKLAHARRTVTGAILVVTETVFSMDGDNGALAQILDLCDQFGAQAVVDEAHSTGIFGPGGAGLACALGLENRFFARIYTFGKGMGAHGACVVGSRDLVDYLINFARPFIYTTAMPLHNLATLWCACDYLAAHPELAEQLQRVVAGYAARTEGLGLPVEVKKIVNQSPIQVLVVPGSERCRALAAHLVAHGCEVRAIVAPTVRAGEERLRICLHAFNTEAELDALAGALASFGWG
jgi:8-amino-7-oxononanoate synthase